MPAFPTGTTLVFVRKRKSYAAIWSEVRTKNEPHPIGLVISLLSTICCRNTNTRYFSMIATHCTDTTNISLSNQHTSASAREHAILVFLTAASSSSSVPSKLLRAERCRPKARPVTRAMIETHHFGSEVTQFWRLISLPKPYLKKIKLLAKTE